MSEALTHNRYPDLLSVKWSVVPVPRSANARYDLYLSLESNDRWQRLGKGRFQWALKAIDISVSLNEAIWLPEASQERDLSGIHGSAIASEEPDVLTWEIAALKAGHPLQGSLLELKWGTFEVNSDGASVQIECSAKGSQVHIVTTEGLWSHHISPNQLAIAEQALALSLLDSSETLALSSMGWQTEVAKLDDEKGDGDEWLRDRVLPIIEKITTATTDNFLELAELAGLNIATDLAGAKLLGTHLNGLDLSSANLRRVYLRGAQLCDADLSNACLEGANFTGADLSGVLLSDAPARGANFHRASLALANLSGAKLNNADFTEANLSNANLSDADLTGANLSHADLTGAGLVLSQLTNVNLDGAKVERSRFKDNPGLTEAMQEDLRSRGAIFE